MGSSTAYHLAKWGLKTLCLERFALNHTLGSSHGRTRIIRTAYYEHPSYVPLIKRAFELWRDLERESGEHLLTMTGGLFVGPASSDLFSGALRSAVEHDLDYQVLDAAQISDRFPPFKTDSDEMGLLEKQAGILFPEKVIQSYVRLAMESGNADFHIGEALADWKNSNNNRREAIVKNSKGQNTQPTK